jgi:hypothetical protein
MEQKKCGCKKVVKPQKPAQNQAPRPVSQPTKPKIEETRKG